MEQQAKSVIWKSLTEYANLYINTQSSHQKLPQKTLTLSTCGITLDYTHQHLSPPILEKLIALAHTCQLKEKIEALMCGDTVNVTEKRPALHTALRASDDTNIWVDNQNIMPFIVEARHQIKHISEKVRSMQWFGYSGKPITDIVNIGIGGSDLGPRFCLNALKHITSSDLHYHFVSDVDPYSLETTIASLQPETTLFIVTSKSFTTQETLYNAQKAMNWFGQNPIKNHFIAITAQIEKARQFGMTTILPIWEWVGGRFSACSAVNLITAIAIGFEAFSQFLAGANAMDKHFLNAEFEQNMPSLLGLIGIWNNNFLHINNLLILTYARQLEQLTPFIQQLDMESNGKSVDIHGKKLTYATGPMIWGGLGNQAQHSYYQSLCQGTHQVTADFVSIDAFEGELINQMCSNKMRVLTQGIHDENDPYACIQGKKPLNHIRLNDYSPFSIGALIALYEHKIFTQSVIWNINPFDQPGVESAKKTRAEAFS
ncbi:MAG: glucose-6-phosphate isomerase [Gammaproteobacteria bacterium]|nr:glucose-6-phosphate isomerase [Gammaproteobacteria bacterium]